MIRGGVGNTTPDPDLTGRTATSNENCKWWRGAAITIGACVYQQPHHLQLASQTAVVQLMNMYATAEAEAGAKKASSSEAEEDVSVQEQPSLPLLQKKSPEAQALLAKDWQELSTTERQAIHNDVNGVSNDAGAPSPVAAATDSGATGASLVEDPVMIERCLQQMEQEINHVRRLRSSYDRAMFLAPHRIKDKAFRLMFLRAENFDSYRATQRVSLFLTSQVAVVVLLFGRAMYLTYIPCFPFVVDASISLSLHRLVYETF